jgi:two-component system, NarL family, sensor histidine kinase UhpB
MKTCLAGRSAARRSPAVARLKSSPQRLVHESCAVKLLYAPLWWLSVGFSVVGDDLAATNASGTDPDRPAQTGLGSRLRGPYSIRTQLLLVLSALMAMAWVVGGGVTILHARKATHIEINAAMELAEALVRDAIPFVQQSNSPERALASIPDQVGSVRHVRISFASEASSPSLSPDKIRKDSRRSETRAPAPAWFAELIAPPLESREVPIFVNGKHLGSIVIASAPGDEIAEVWENATSLAGVALLTGTMSIIVLYIVFGRVLAPLHSLAEGLRDLGLNDYNVRLPQPKARELATIAQRFNSLASALESMMVKNRKLSTRLITVQDDERRQTALNLHDEVGPYLFGLKANATSIANSSKGAVAEIRAREMLGMIDALQTINRSVLNRLRPMALGQVPLGELLSSLIEERARQFPDMSIAYSSSQLRNSYGESIDVTVYRCVQESLTNVIRHAGAQRARVTVAHESDTSAGKQIFSRLILTIADDGRGIKLDGSKGLGIQGMRERVEALGGNCQIGGATDHGTTVRIEIPVPSGIESSIALRVTDAGSQRHDH